MGHPSLMLKGPLLPPFFKAASCEVSFRRARGALRCYAQNLSSSAGHRRGFHEIKKFPARVQPSARTRWRESDARGSAGKTAVKRKRERRREEGDLAATWRKHRLDRFCSDERVMDIKWTHGTHRQINSICRGVASAPPGVVLTSDTSYALTTMRTRLKKNKYLQITFRRFFVVDHDIPNTLGRIDYIQAVLMCVRSCA